MNKRKMNLNKIVEMAKWFAAEGSKTHLIRVSGHSVHVAPAGLSEVGIPEVWKWNERSCEKYPHEAYVKFNGVTFFAIFTDEERDEVVKGELPIDK